MTRHLAVKLTVVPCSVCGGDVVYDNLGDGREPQHLDRPDDHHVKFGNLERAAPPLVGLDLLEALLDEDEVPPWPGPGQPRAAVIGDGTKGRDHGDLGPNTAGCRQIHKAATKAGFTIDATFCTGPVVVGHASRGEWRLVDSLALSMTHPDGRSAVAAWERKDGGTFEYQWAILGDEVRLEGSAALKAYLRG